MKETFSRLRYAIVLPVLLATLFVFQNYVFTVWTDLTPNRDVLFLLLASASLGLFLYAPAVLMSRRTQYVYLTLASSIASLVFISQYIHFSFFSYFLQASALKYASQVGAEGSTIFSLLTPRILFFALPFPIILIAYLSTRTSYAYFHPALRKKERLYAASIIATVVLGGYGIILATSEGGLQKISHPFGTLYDLGRFTYSPKQTVQRVGIWNYFFADLIGTLLHTDIVTTHDRAFVKEVIAQKASEKNGHLFSIARDRNLIIIQVESLEAKVIGLTVEGQEITPYLNTLSKRGAYFNNYYTQIGPGNTADAEFSTLNSLYPLTNTVAFVDYANNTFHALPTLLTHHGYYTYVLHGDVADFWNRAKIYPTLGYQQAINRDAFTADQTEFDTLSDEDFFTQSLEKMSSFRQPFLATLLTMSSHSPFVIPKKYQTLTIATSSPLSQPQRDYIQSIHYTDQAIGAFIEGLKEKGLYDHSLIVIYGDHGVPAAVSATLEDASDAVLPSLRSSRVPLIIIEPGKEDVLQGVRTIPGSHIDLYPTLAHLLGLHVPKSTFGQDLLAPTAPVVTHRDPYYHIITTILTPDRAYENGGAGTFEEGHCLAIPSKKELPLDDCKKIYEEQEKVMKASDLIIRGNVISQLSLE